MIGLTATPFRTADDEQGLLAKIYEDGLQSGKVIHGNIGITYQIELKDLINRRILSKPVFEREISSLPLQMRRALSGVWETLVSVGDEKPLRKAAQQLAFMSK